KSIKDNNGVRVIKEIKLWEGSAVPLGANPSTPFNGFKSANTIKEANDYIAKITKLFRNGNLTDDGFAQLEFALKQLQLESYELGKKHSGKIIEPSNDTQVKDFEPLLKTINNFKF